MWCFYCLAFTHLQLYVFPFVRKKFMYKEFHEYFLFSINLDIPSMVIFFFHVIFLLYQLQMYLPLLPVTNIGYMISCKNNIFIKVVIMIIHILIYVSIFITMEITQSISYKFIFISYTLNSECVLVHNYF